MLDGLTQGLNVIQVTDALKAMRVWEAWKVMLAYAEDHSTGMIEFSQNFLTEKPWNNDRG